MTRRLLALLGALLLACVAALPADAAPAAPVHTNTEIQNIGIVIDVGLYGPENNGWSLVRYQSVHFGYHYAELCYANGASRHHWIYNINTGYLQNEPANAFCGFA